jgi:hypothetical protein
MNPSEQASVGTDSRRKHQVGAILLTLLPALLVALLLLTIPNVVAAVQQPGEEPVRTGTLAADVPRAPAQTTILTLAVVSARDEPRAFGGAGVNAGDPVTEYDFQIVLDNTGDPFDDTDCWAYTDYPTNTIRNPNYPDGCEWPGVHTTPGWAPIVTQGTQDELNTTTGIDLPPGKYLISVLADGYKVDGEHFTVPLADPGLIEVAVHPHPLPPSSMLIKVFNDNSMTNSQFDAPVEQPAPGPTSMAGFRVSLNDIAGEITADLFGNPLCTEYEKDANGDVLVDESGMPLNIVKMGGECLSDDYGIINIPNIGPMRYDVLVTPPDGTDWVQTTTLEGSHGWDTWLQEAGTGLDNEFIVAGEPFPWTIFGFVRPTDTLTLADPSYGSVKGVIMGITTYSPSQGGLPHEADVWGGLMAAKLDEPIAYPWLSLNSLQGGDTAVWVGIGEADGSFQIDNVPPGDYFLAYWDMNQHYILDFVQLTVEAGQTTDVGVRTMTNWFTKWFGTVFLDYNENGRQDKGEPGVPDYLVVLRDRDNTEIDRMSIASVTDVNGDYALEKGYPMSSWMVLEAYSDIYRTTGITYQASNATEETTILGPIVDVGVLPIFSQWGRLDWGVKFYGPGTNGGIAGSVFYDTVRAEDDARYAGAEPWQPGIPELEMRLYATVKNAEGVILTDTTPGPNYGAALKGELLGVTTTENFVRPKNCQPLDVYGEPVDFPSFPPTTGDYDCLEGPPMGVQFSQGQQELPGNWGFGEIDKDPATGAPLPQPIPIPPGDYLVEVTIPTDPYTGRPQYEVTREEDLNIYDGDVFYPEIPPPACAGPLHIVDVANIGTDGYELPWQPGVFSTPVENPGYVEVGGSRFEGEAMPLCNVKLVSVVEEKGVAPIFTLWTRVPIPGRWRGYIIDDLNVSTNPHELFFGEKAGMANMPMGIYDFTGRLVHTVHSDFHGVYEVLLPSAATYNAPSPSGMLASVYYIYGNDPGQPGAFNPLYHPGYRSIGTSFEVYPGVLVPSDLAPTQNGALIWNPTSNVSQLAACKLEDTTPQLFAVDKPYIQDQGNLTIYGLGFGTYDPRNSRSAVWLDTNRLDIVSWTDREIVAFVGRNVSPGPHQLSIVASNNQTTVNGLTIHVLRTPANPNQAAYQPNLYEVGPGRTYDPIDYSADEGGPIQHAIDDAAADGGPGLVVVYPGLPTPFVNPLGFYLENPVIYSPVKLQGIGPGGVYADGTGVLGTILDGRGMGGTEVYAEWWRVNVGDIWLNRGGWDGSPVDDEGNPRLYEGQVLTVFAEDGEFTDGYYASIDGFKIQGGDQQGFPNNLNQIGGGRIPGVPAEVVIQGGGIFVNGYARHLRITNNHIENNGGAYAGAIRLGTPDMLEPYKDHQNDNVVIAHNRIMGNGGTNLAGAIGLFAGAENYTIMRNDICGNFSAEYGGGISHYGESPGGSISHNRIYFNRSYDEGGGIMIAGELPVDPTLLSDGAGPVDIYANLIQGNLSNDDGGGLRFLMAGDFTFNVYNNMIVNNVSTHEGGGVSLNDAPDVRFYNNTVMNNLTTATAMTSNGLAAPAGFSSSRNSDLLQATLPADAPTFSDALMFNNIFWDNRAGTWTGDGVAGIGLEGDPSPIFYWDLGVASNAGALSPTYTLMQVQNGVPDASNLVGMDPLVVAEYDSSVRVFPWRGNPNFVGADIVAVELPVTLIGDYHLSPDSPAINAGIDPADLIAELNQDYDRQPRPSQNRFEIGADETGQAFPNTPILYPLAADTQAADVPPEVVSLNAEYYVYLPLILNAATPTTYVWGGETDDYLFDATTGIQVVDSGAIYWRASSFGTDQEAYFTFTDVAETATRQDLLLKMGGLAVDGRIGAETYLINVGYNATDGTVLVTSLSPGNVWHTHAIFGGMSFAVGDVFGARATVGGLVEVYQNGMLIGRADLSTGENPWAYNGDTGWIGLWFEWPVTPPDGASLTDFGGGTMPW